jgi:hypothetical protein
VSAVSEPAANADQHFPLIAVVALAGTRGAGVLYPELSRGKSGRTKTSFAFIDQLCSIDTRCVRRVFGRTTTDEPIAIDQGLELFQGLTGGGMSG